MAAFEFLLDLLISLDEFEKYLQKPPLKYTECFIIPTVSIELFKFVLALQNTRLGDFLFAHSVLQRVFGSERKLTKNKM